VISGFLVDENNQVLLEHVFRTSNVWERARGLLGKRPITDNEGLLIDPCSSVHTFFMNYSIDLVYLDRQFTIKKLVHAIKPWRMSACHTASMTLELPANMITRLNLQTEMQLIWSTND